MDETKTLTLRKPLRTGPTSEVTSLELREPTAGEMRRATGDGIGSNIKLVAAVTGIEEPFIEKLGARDFQEAVQFLAGFTQPGPEIGES